MNLTQIMDFSWLYQEALLVSPIGEPGDDARRYVVTDAGKLYACVLSAIDGTVLVNGTAYDFGDELPVVLGLLDEVADNPDGDEIFIPAATYDDDITSPGSGYWGPGGTFFVN